MIDSLRAQIMSLEERLQKKFGTLFQQTPGTKDWREHYWLFCPAC
jgi:hypothetical protein